MIESLDDLVIREVPAEKIGLYDAWACAVWASICTDGKLILDCPDGVNQA